MKKKVVLIFGLVLVGLFSLGTSIAWGEVSSLPRVTTVCESKAGLLMTVDDDFSILRKCPKNFRKVVLGEEQTIKNDESNELGEVLFASNFNILKKNGEIWNYSPGDEGLFEWSYIGEIPEEVEASKILQWDENSFLTKEGIFYVKKQMIWEKVSEFPTDR